MTNTSSSSITRQSRSSSPSSIQHNKRRRQTSSPATPIMSKTTMTTIKTILFLVGLVFLTSGNNMVVQAQSSSSNNRQVQRYPLPTFSMLLKVRIDEILSDRGDDDYYDEGEIYLDLEMFQETLERVTQLHLTDIFQQAESRVMEFDEQFLRIQLSSKVRQDIVSTNEEETTSHHQHATTTTIDGAASAAADVRVHVPLHAGFSGVVSYSFPQGVLPSEDRVDMLIHELLESALVGENYMLLFRRYLSSGVLADIEDVEDIRIGTQLLNVAETPPPKEEHDGNGGKDDDGSSSSSSTDSASSNKKKKKQLNAVTIVAIVIFLTLSCLLMIFGATVVLLMKDRAKQERKYNGQTMRSIGMGANGGGSKRNSSSTNGEGDKNDDDSSSSGDDEDDDARTATTEESITPAWKRVVLPVLRKAIMVRRYWRQHIRKQKRNSNQPSPSDTGNPNEAASSSNNVVHEEDDGLNDEDVYYDENLSDEEAAAQWLDAWQASITSIPVRTISSRSPNHHHAGSPNKKHVKKKKASKSPLAPRPAKRQSKKAFLCCIAEEDSVVDTNSIMDPAEYNNGNPNHSSYSHDVEMAMMNNNNGSGGPSTPTPTNNTTRICLELERIEELANDIMEKELHPETKTTTSSKQHEPQQQEKRGTSVSPTPPISKSPTYNNDKTPTTHLSSNAGNPAALTASASFPGAYGSSARKKRGTFDDEDGYEGFERVQDVDLS